MMREIFNISTNDLFVSSLSYIEKRLEPFKKAGLLTAKITRGGGRNQLTIVLNGAKRGKAARNNQNSLRDRRALEAALVDALAEVVITDCKVHFIQTSLKLPIEDEISRHAFIRALSGFDRDPDKIIAKSLIKIDANFLLDSFYAFSIDILKTRWLEVCELANENACFLVCDGTFRELLRFLISNLESREPEVHLFRRENGGVDVLTGGLKPINVYIGGELSPDVQVVSKLISIAPKRIFLHRNISDSPVFDFIQSVFGSCVKVLQT